MKRLFLIATTVAATVILLSSCKKEKEPQPKQTDDTPITEFTDSRDGIIYPVVKIGDQYWMQMNLRYNSSGSFLPDVDEFLQIDIGRFYKSNQLAGIAPQGWRVATNNDWKKLEAYYGMSYNHQIMMNNIWEFRGTQKDSIMGHPFYAAYTGRYNGENYDQGFPEATFLTSDGFKRVINNDSPGIENYYSGGSSYGNVRCVKE